jgi:apolipoprotein N-acyltransferase
MDEFWWAIPLGLFGIPLFMALFIACGCFLSWHFRESKFYHFIFCVSWVFFEWLTSWIFTGLPWAVMGYALSFSTILIQGASLFSVFGLSFLTVYIGSGLYPFITKQSHIFRPILVTSFITCLSLFYYGYSHLADNPTTLTDIKVRLVQPSIPQTSKWDPEIFWDNLDKHIELSTRPGNPDIIIWSEAALTIPYHLKPVTEVLKSAFTNDNQILILGAVSTDKIESVDFKLFSSLVAMDRRAATIFEYHKSHVVPFGEYIPFKSFLPFKKLTHGIIDYTQGVREVVSLNKYNLKIQPMICYESIFPAEVRIANSDADVIINVTNDAWYGNSSGPYQHFEISRMRTIENGLPMIRVGNNGISAIIDPVGRVIDSMELNGYDILDGFIPQKISKKTIYSVYGYSILLLLMAIVLILQVLVMFVPNVTKKL